MVRKYLLVLVLAAFFMLANCQLTPPSTPTMVFNATYGLVSNFSIQSLYQYKWVEVLPDATTSKIRQTFMNSLGTANKTQFQLELTGNIQPVAIAANNFTCVMIKELSSNTFSSYILDSTAQTITLFNNMSYISDLSSLVVQGSNLTITEDCKALKINNKIYHYNIGNSQYVQDVLPFALTGASQLLYEQAQLNLLIHNGSIYNYNISTHLYQLQRTDNISEQAQLIRSDIYPERVLINSGVWIQNRFVFRITINEFRNGELVKIKQINDSSEFYPYFKTDRTLSRIIYTVGTNNNGIRINGLFVNYKKTTVSNMNIPPIFYTINAEPVVLLTQNYLYVRQTQGQADVLRQYIMQFLGNQILTINQRTYSQNQNFGFQKAIIQQRDTQISVFLQKETEPFMYFISQVVYDKISSQPTIPNAPDPNLFSFTYPGGGVNLLRSSVNPRWMYLNFDGSTSTTVTGQVFAIGETNNKITITDTRAGNWNILGGTDITLNCAVAFDSMNNVAKIFYYNQNTRAAEVKADVTTILAAESVSDPSTVQFDVSDECTFFKIGASVYHYNGTDYLNVTITDNQNNPTNFVNAVFDQTFKIAVVNGTIYQYYEPNNRYYIAFTPTQAILANKQIFFNQDKLLILSSTTNLANPPVSQYRVHCLWSNGSNWMNIDVDLEGSSLYKPPGIGVTPNFQIFGIGGIKQDGSPFIQGRYVQHRNIVEFHNATVKQTTIPSEMMYNNQIPYIKLSDNYLYYRRLPSLSTPISQNHQAFYQIDKQNGLLKFINKRNLTIAEQAIWKNTFVRQINNSMVVFYETQDSNTVKLTQRIVGNANGGGAPTANIVESDTGVLMIGNKTYMCSVGCSSCLTANQCEQCSEGFALDSVSKNCKRCKGSCKTCSTSDASTCTSCFPGTFLSVDSCLPCGSTCLECDTLANNCTACKPGKILNSGAGTCSACPLSNCVDCQDVSTCLKCRPGFALNSTNQCVQCTSTCSQCDPTNVLTCLACRDGFELNTTSNKCIKCPDHCKVCVNQICSECNRNFRVTSSGRCAKKCEFPCMSCSDTNPSSCLSCSGQYVLSGSRCIPNTNCNSTSTCQKCAVGYILFQGKCYPCQAGNTCKQCDFADPTLCLSCVKGFYLDQASICIACPNQCTGCETAQSCTSCKDGYTLPADSTTSQCLACESPCQTCISSTTNCLTCVSGYKLQGWKCRSKINIEFVFELTVVFSSLTTADILSILNDIATILGIPIDHITLLDAQQGSLVLSGSSDASSAAAVSSGLASLSSASSGSSLGGFPIVSSTFTGNDGSQDDSEQGSKALTIALAVAIPVIIITTIIVLVILYKKGLIFAKTAAITQQVQLQSLDNINPMNLKELRFTTNQQFGPTSNPSIDPSYNAISYE